MGCLARDAALAQTVALLRNGDPAAAVSLCEAMLSREPDFPPAHVLLACALLACGDDWPAALRAAERAAALAPGAAPAHFVRGTALHALGRAAEAVAALQAALALAPDDAGAWLNLGNALLTLDRTEAAKAALRRACTLAPCDARAHASLGTALVQDLRLPDAIAAYRRALALQPDCAAMRWDLGFARLLSGDWSGGWADWRQRKPEETAALQALGVQGAEWDGGAVAGRTLLACSSQGLGDAIQFARYLPLLAQHGARVILACDVRLARLLGGLDGVAGVATPADALPAHDAWVALSSLPRSFAAIPAAHGYLTADPARAAGWRAELAGEGPAVGLVWAGPAFLAPVLAVPGLRCVSLQIGGDVSLLSARVSDLAPRLTDLAETAAVLAALDLVITVDTAMAHLAGALGCPAWVALPYSPDWRWQLGRSDSPWYASARLFRQPRAGDWGSVGAALAAALARVVRPRPPVCSE